ncbi:MAG: hypothetical protein HUJ56_01995 [Erysipelotrichaceae bacterium]|nr:hypothetical protein [Erysipelotrichaceae bacterium]
MNKVYKTYWNTIKALIQGLPLKDNITEEEFKSLKTSFNIPSLGKLYCRYRKKDTNLHKKTVKDAENKED